MKNILHFFRILALILILFSCSKEEDTNISGEWDTSFAVTRGIDTLKIYSGVMTIQVDKNQITGNILFEDENSFLFTEFLPGGFLTRTHKIHFESFAWLVNDSISTLTLTYSGTVNTTRDHMVGIFTSGARKIGDWSAVKK